MSTKRESTLHKNEIKINAHQDITVNLNGYQISNIDLKGYQQSEVILRGEN